MAGWTMVICWCIVVQGIWCPWISLYVGDLYTIAWESSLTADRLYLSLDGDASIYYQDSHDRRDSRIVKIDDIHAPKQDA